MTPQEICTQAKVESPRIGIATVYRFVREMLAKDELCTVEIPGAAPRYELAHKEHHHHFLCRNCGQVYELPGCLPGVNKLAPKNFKVDSHEIVLFGRCDQCGAN